ncbi:ubiquitin-like-specific protease ESD4 [Neltuma alba]|uniref:ubiquitin-like-specific protease ESD4 n=1 Tax=Neltuma alba TaxID=207710 RepID=UPI0010A39956|nr:ubiquitin-like-specific protease ESD4 [Prosopis alba]
MEEKDKFFNMISRMCSSQEGDVSDEDITQDQLRTLGGIERIGNQLMSVVCKILLADMKSEGEAKRHIFDTDFMAIMAVNPSRWDARKREKQFSPEYVDYNIGDCDLIFGPTLIGAHWFCLVIEPKTMNFYVLDSMKPSFAAKKSKKKGVADDDMMTVVIECRDRFYDMIEIVKPNTIGKKKMSDIIWAPVPQQNNLRDCGVHILIWLSEWEPSVMLDYSEEHVANFE